MFLMEPGDFSLGKQWMENNAKFFLCVSLTKTIKKVNFTTWKMGKGFSAHVKAANVSRFFFYFCFSTDYPRTFSRVHAREESFSFVVLSIFCRVIKFFIFIKD